MCDDDIHQGTPLDPALSRRAFGATAFAVTAFSAAELQAQAAVVEKDVSVTTPDGSCDAALFTPPGRGRHPGVVIWPDIMGLRPVFRDMGRRLASQGYVVLVVNPFYRAGPATASAGLDFMKPEGRAGLVKMAQALNQETAFSDGKAFAAFLDAQPQVDKRRKLGVQGYCMGGPLTIRTAAAVPERYGAAVTFHGGGLATDKPDSPHLLAPRLKARLAILVADNDDQRDPKAKETLKAALDAAKVPSKVEVYAGCAHGWTVKGSPVYNEAGAERAWAELTATYKAALA